MISIDCSKSELLNVFKMKCTVKSNELSQPLLLEEQKRRDICSFSSSRPLSLLSLKNKRQSRRLESDSVNNEILGQGRLDREEETYND